MCDELNARCNELKADLTQADDVIFQQAVENERLKSELRKKAIDAISDIGQLGEQSAEINHLKAEIDKLRKDAEINPSQSPHEVTRLKAEVERLRKAGDAMASSIQFNEEMAKDYNGPTVVHQSVKAWNAAKEGKPSV